MYMFILFLSNIVLFFKLILFFIKYIPSESHKSVGFITKLLGKLLKSISFTYFTN